MIKPHSKRRKAKSLFRRAWRLCLRHTWLLPLILILGVLGAYLVSPGPKNPFHKVICLSYNIGPDHPGGLDRYAKGRNDILFVTFYTIVFSFTREFTMQRIIRPLAARCGITRRAKQARFMEQAYTALYFSIFGPFGLYVMYNAEGGSLWYFETTPMFEGFPHLTHDGIFKAYYLLQASYWSQQAIVLLLQLEKPRKDFKELVLHHIVTLTLIGLSYRFHFARMGIAVFITHDISDFFLATSKTFNYLDLPIVGPYFALFIFVWIYMRHYINLRILWATLTEFRSVGPFELNWGAQQYKCWISQYLTFALLFSLQAVNLFWLFLILRIAKNYVFNSVVQDERSDNDETEDDIKVSERTKQQTLQHDTSSKPNPPIIQVNGEAVNMDMKPEGITKRRKG